MNYYSNSTSINVEIKRGGWLLRRGIPCFFISTFFCFWIWLYHNSVLTYFFHQYHRVEVRELTQSYLACFFLPWKKIGGTECVNGEIICSANKWKWYQWRWSFMIYIWGMKVVQRTVSYAPGGRSLKDVNVKTTRAIIYSMPGGEIKIISITLKFVLSTQAAKTKPKGI